MAYFCQAMTRIEDELKSRFESPQHKVLLNLLFTANWLRNEQTALFKPFGISAQQYNILRILRGARGRMNMHSVKERMIDRSPNATRLTDKLIAKGLVHRERCEEDRRVVYVCISESGLDLLGRIDRHNRAFMREVTRRMSDTDADIINRVLDDIRG